MVPMLTCGLVRSNFAFATGSSCGLITGTPYDVSGTGTAVRATRPWPSRSSLLDLGSFARGLRDVSLLGSRLAPLLASLRCSLACRLRDDLLRDVPGNLRVGVELHGVARAALGLRPQIADVAEHLRERHDRAHDARTAPLLHRLDEAPAGVEVADDVTHVLFRGGDLDGHHRLEQHRVGLTSGLLQRDRTGDLERHLRGVDLVVGAIDEGQLDPD